MYPIAGLPQHRPTTHHAPVQPQVPGLVQAKLPNPVTKHLQPRVDLQADYQKLFGAEKKPSDAKSIQTRQLSPAIKINVPSSVAPQGTKSFAGSRWDMEPTEPQDKLKELQQTLAAVERKNHELEQVVVQAESRASTAHERETQMTEKLSSANADFMQLKTDYEVLKTETVYVHQELQVLLDENEKLKSLATQSEQALLQAAAALTNHETQGELHASSKAVEAAASEKASQMQAELSNKQAELDSIKPQVEQLKLQLNTTRLELRAKENQLKETMVFNKKSMSVTSKLNECVKTQEKQIAELKWTNGMHENELKEKSLKIEALQAQLAQAAVNEPAPAVSSPALTAELAAKDAQIKQLREGLQESNKALTLLQESKSININWNAAKLSPSMKEYLTDIATHPGGRGGGITGAKRKLGVDEGNTTTEEERGIVQLNKRALRGILQNEADIAKDVDQAMTAQQAALAKAQRALLQHQAKLREAEGVLETNLIRKRCLEARAKVLREQETLVNKVANEVESACSASQESLLSLKEQKVRLSEDVEKRRTALVETQLGATELQVEARVRNEASK